MKTKLFSKKKNVIYNIEIVNKTGNDDMHTLLVESVEQIVEKENKIQEMENLFVESVQEIVEKENKIQELENHIIEINKKLDDVSTVNNISQRDYEEKIKK
jgi:hypothetical protein